MIIVIRMGNYFCKPQKYIQLSLNVIKYYLLKGV